jgi:protein O-mannosyl-transferase
MGRRPKKHQPLNHRTPGRRKERALGTPDRDSAPGEIRFRQGIAPGTESCAHDHCAVLAVCGFLLLAVVLVFGQTLQHEFIGYDDSGYVYKNPQVTGGLTVEGITWAFTTNHASNWHPLTWLSHMVDCQLYGLSPGGHHLTNVLLHAAVAILLFLVLRRMTGDLWPSAWVAAVFAIHPLRAESVAWVAERKDVLSGLFFMLTLGAYVSYVRCPSSLVRYSSVVALFALGLMAKPMLVTLPFVLLLLDYWPLRRWGRSTVSRLIVEKLPLLLLAAASCVATPLAQGHAVRRLDAVPILARISNALVSYVAYLGNFFYPAGLAAFYPYLKSSLPIGEVIGACVVLAGISVGALVWRRRLPYFFVGWFWYLGMLVPVIGLVQVGMQSMADRYTYLPQIGLCLALTWGAADAIASWPAARRLCCFGAGLVLLVLMGCAWRQTSSWRDSETLWTRALACTKRNAKAHFNLGTARDGRGQTDAAIACYEEALAIEPAYADAHYNLGNILVLRGQIEQSIAHYQRAVQLKPDDADTHNNLGVALARTGRLDAAIAECRKALELKPQDISARTNLDRALSLQAQIVKTLVQQRELLRASPNNLAMLNDIAWKLATSPDASVRSSAEAVELAERAAKISERQDPTILDTLAAAYAEAGRFSEAVDTAERASALASAGGNTALGNTLLARIKLYQAGSPYRENHAAPQLKGRKATP